MKKSLFILISTLFAATVSAQNITGRVLDAAGNPLPGASVYWADTNVGEAADVNGNFRLHRVKDYNNLVGSFLGYTNDTIVVDKNTTEVIFNLTEGVAVESVVVEFRKHEVADDTFVHQLSENSTDLFFESSTVSHNFYNLKCEI